MDKVGRNDSCPCGSGKKYKNCCINKDMQQVDEDDLLRIRDYGSEAYEKAELDKFSRFFIETTADEKFEIQKSGQGYIVKDIVPPENTMQAKDYRTVELNDIQRQRLIKHIPQRDSIDIGKHDYFDGIVEGGHLTWERFDGYTSSRGTICKLYIRQALGNYILNVNLFPQKAEFKSISEYLQTGFSIYTQSNKFDFVGKEGRLYFEDNQVYAILSVIDKESFSIDEIFSTTPKEYNVSYDVVIGKPFFILKVHGECLKISIIDEQVIDVTKLKE